MGFHILDGQARPSGGNGINTSPRGSRRLSFLAIVFFGESSGFNFIILGCYVKVGIVLGG